MIILNAFEKIYHSEENKYVCPYVEPIFEKGRTSIWCDCCGVGGQSCNKTETLDSQKFLIPAFTVPFYYSRIFLEFFRILFEWGGKTIRSLFLHSAPMPALRHSLR